MARCRWMYWKRRSPAGSRQRKPDVWLWSDRLGKAGIAGLSFWSAKYRLDIDQVWIFAGIVVAATRSASPRLRIAVRKDEDTHPATRTNGVLRMNTRLLVVLGLIVLAALIVSGLSPHDRLTWLME